MLRASPGAPQFRQGTGTACAEVAMARIGPEIARHTAASNGLATRVDRCAPVERALLVTCSPSALSRFEMSHHGDAGRRVARRRPFRPTEGGWMRRIQGTSLATKSARNISFISGT